MDVTSITKGLEMIHRHINLLANKTRNLAASYFRFIDLHGKQHSNKALQNSHSSPIIRMTGSGSFSYQALNDRETQIRILQILPGSFTDKIACSLKVESLTDQIQYEALSYTWGTEELSVEIQLNNTSFQVSPNLEQALRRIRLPDSPRRLWIDAISINQSDIPERNTQVRVMRKIYESAQRVLVWLGEEQDNSDMAMAKAGIMENFHALDTASWESAMASPRWIAFTRLVERPWWRRIWVIQEVAVAKSALVLCGSKSLDWNTLLSNIAMLCQIVDTMGEDAPLLDTRGIDFALHLAAFRINRQKPDYVAPGISELMQTFRPRESTDPRDKCYGLLGLSNPDSEGNMQADYGLAVHELYQKVTQNFVSHSASLNVFALVDPTNKVEKLASWAPSWIHDLPFNPLRQSSLFDPLRFIYKASGDQTIDAEFSPSGDKITLTAVMLGELIVTVPWPISNHAYKPFLRHLEKTMLTMMGNLKWISYSDEQKSREAIRRTLIADEFNGSRLSDEEYARFSAWFDRDESETKKPEGISPDISNEGVTCKEISIEEYNRILPDLISDSARNLDPRRNKEAEKEHEEFSHAIAITTKGRKICVNMNLFVGLAPMDANDGDIICVPQGSEVPWLIREAGNGEYEFVGECYVHGIMDGDVLHRIHEDRMKKLTLR